MKTIWGVCVTLVALGAGCSSGGSGLTTTTPMCPAQPFTGCGGDVAGSWKLAGYCRASPNAACPTASIEISKLTWTITAKADGTFTESLGGAATDVFPGACIGAGKLAGSCDELKQQKGFASCSATADGGCRCDESAVAVTSDSGTWMTAGNNVTLTDQAGTPQSTAYCVSGNTLQIAYVFGDVLLFTR